MARRYHLSPLPTAGRLDLDLDVSHHLARVMRVRVGDPVVLFDGAGQECDASVVAIEGSGKSLRVSADIGAPRPSDREPETRIHVVFASPKGNRAEWVFEHGTEVGIAAFHPVTTERSSGAERLERWRRIVIAATGQCDRGRIPAVHHTRSLADVLADANLPQERYVADAGGPQIVAATSRAAVLLVGPEGGLTESEMQLAGEYGFQPRSLGVTTLRSEMAVVAGALLLLQG